MSSDLWASTSTKDPSYSDVMYVDELVGPTRLIPSHRTRLKPAPTAMLPTALRLAEEAYKLIDNLKDPDININLDDDE